MYEYKLLGETTSEFSNRLKKKHNVKKLCIIGKLDPMAHGYTKILFEEETKLMNQYLNSDKNYNFSIAIGFSTDTDDIMGIIQKIANPFIIHEVIDNINNIVYNYCRINIQKFHKFSAIKVKINGITKSLHSHNNVLNENIPEKSVKIYDIIRLNNYIKIPVKDYIEEIFNRLNKINDKETFRINDIINSYSKLNSDIILINYNITVSSGFYIRMISNHINEVSDIPVHIYNIYRTQL